MLKKTGIKLKTVFILAVFLVICKGLNAQCDNNLRREAYKLIEGGTYIRDFKVSLNESKPKKPATDEKSIILSKGNRYRFVIIKDPMREGEPVLRVFDQHTEYATNLTAGNNSAQAFDFICTNTQVYSLSVHFQNGKDGCCILMLGLMGGH